MRFVLRLIGLLCVAAGFVALVVDGTALVANHEWAPASLGAVAAKAFPKTFPLIEPSVVRNLHPLVWDPVLVTLLRAPAFAAGLVVGFALLLLARKPRQEIGFSTRR